MNIVKEGATSATATATAKFTGSSTTAGRSSHVVKFRLLTPLIDSVVEPALRKAHLEGRIEDFSIWLKTDGRSKLPSNQSEIEKHFSSLPDPKMHLRCIAEAAFNLHEIQPGQYTFDLACTNLRQAVFDAVMQIEGERFRAAVAAKPDKSHYEYSARAASEIYATGIADYFVLRLSEHLNVAVRAVA